MVYAVASRTFLTERIQGTRIWDDCWATQDAGECNHRVLLRSSDETVWGECGLVEDDDRLTCASSSPPLERDADTIIMRTGIHGLRYKAHVWNRNVTDGDINTGVETGPGGPQTTTLNGGKTQSSMCSVSI